MNSRLRFAWMAPLVLVGCSNPEGSALLEGPPMRSISPAPVYPPMARMARISGELQVQGTLGPGGQVLTCQARSGPPMLRPAAEAWVRQWAFQSPTEKETGFLVKVRFRMADDAGTEAYAQYPWCVTGAPATLDTTPTF
ncbi:MAG TPA: energy transducer TonB [Holophagaceae bacterium]|nr:energy transducer TonB [Holophagaceae bacterium]